MELLVAYNGRAAVFFSIHRFWKGVYLHFPKRTVRIFLWGIDWRANTMKKEQYDKPFRHRPKWQLSMTEQMENVINCPRCLIEYNTEQPLCRLGDEPEELMCPTCWIGITIQIRYDGNDDV